jgi:Mce-associated membrane protein
MTTKTKKTEKPGAEDNGTQDEETQDSATDTEEDDKAGADEDADAGGESKAEAKGGKASGEGDGERRRRVGSSVRGLVGERRDKLTTALILLVLAAVTTTAVLQWRQADHLTQQNRTQQQVRTRAAEFGQALLAYKHTDLTNARTRIQQLTATDFGKSYEAAFDGLADTITKYKADATATVRDTYINQIDGDRAKALVILDSEVRSTAGTRRVIGTKLLLELIREKGQWRVSGLATLQADDETMTKPDGTPTTPKDTGGAPGGPSPSTGP